MFTINDITYCSSSKEVDSKNLTPFDYQYDIKWNPNLGISSLRTFGAKDKHIYKFYGRFMKKIYFTKRINRKYGKSINRIPFLKG